MSGGGGIVSGSFRQAQHVVIDGPHFLLQARPREAAEAIREWASGTLGGGLEIGRAGREGLVSYGVEADEDVHQRSEERARAVHRPGEVGGARVLGEGELGGVVGVEPSNGEPDLDEVGDSRIPMPPWSTFGLFHS